MKISPSSELAEIGSGQFNQGASKLARDINARERTEEQLLKVKLSF